MVSSRMVFWWTGFLGGAFHLLDGLIPAAEPFVALVQTPIVVPWITVQTIVGATAVISGFMTFKKMK